MTPVIARNFERTVYNIFNKRDTEFRLGANQFAYKNGESCGNALIKMQHEILSALDNLFNKAVRLFTMDFSKAFDNVNHHLLAEKLKVSPLSTHVVNWYKSFPFDWKKRLAFSSTVCDWLMVSKGTTQGSVSGPHLFNLFLDDLETIVT